MSPKPLSQLSPVQGLILKSLMNAKDNGKDMAPRVLNFNKKQCSICVQGLTPLGQFPHILLNNAL